MNSVGIQDMHSDQISSSVPCRGVNRLNVLCDHDVFGAGSDARNCNLLHPISTSPVRTGPLSVVFSASNPLSS